MADEKKITMQAECSVNDRKVRTFDKAWHLALNTPTPVKVKLLGFVRIDD